MHDGVAAPGLPSIGEASFRSSIASLLNNQSDSGAFVASPDFAVYQYCWLRDASFVAYALDRVGEHVAASRYHAWAGRTLSVARTSARIDTAIGRHAKGEPLDVGEMPPARFSLSGELVADNWPNFQIDGYGTWLWALREHEILSGGDGLAGELRGTVERIARYLSSFALEPCFDVWEENGGEVHTSTLGSVYAGLLAASAILADSAFADRAVVVADAIRSRTTEAGHFRKSDSRGDVDASLLWLGPAFHVTEPDDPRLAATATAIEATLISPDGGVRRYVDDTYYGGGAWPVLTCSLGWYYARAGRLGDAERCLEWARDRVDDQGRLAEQFGGEERDPTHYREWVERWGTSARDLLWSHAMYLVLCAEVAECS